MARLDWKGTAAEFYARREKEVDEDFLFCPDWLDETDDPLESLYAMQDVLLLEGTCVPGAIVQASSTLFRRRGGDGIAVVTYSFDPFFARCIPNLKILAHTLTTLPGKPVKTDDEQFLASVIKDPSERIFALPVPKTLTAGREAFVTTTVIHRDVLPGGRLCGTVYPFSVCRDRMPDALMIPVRYWIPQRNS